MTEFYNIDSIILIISCLILLLYVINMFKRGRNRTDDDDDNGDGGQLNPTDDPILDLPPGICLPSDKDVELV